MSDEQPLLNKSKHFSVDYDDNAKSTKQLATDTLYDWRRCFRGPTSVDEDYEKLDEDEDGTDNRKETSVTVLELFRFADGMDYFLMVLCVILILIHTACALGTLVLFGRVTGTFATRSFDISCEQQYGDVLGFNQNQSGCPLGITLNSENYDRFSKLCHPQSTTRQTPTIVLSDSEFHAKIMNTIHLLFLVGAVAFLCSSLENFIWTISVKRQTSRMSVLLFRSLIQRNVSYLDMNAASQFNSKLFANIDKIEMGIGFEFLVLVAIVFLMIGSVITSFIVNWKLTLILFCINPFVVCGSLIFSRLMSNETINELRTYSKAGQIVQEVFSSLRTVHSLNGSKFEQKRYERELAPTRWSNIRKGAMLGVFVGWLSLVNYIVYAVGFIFGSLLMSYGGIKHHISISDILVCVSISAQAVSFFSMIGPFFQSVSEAKGAAGPVFRLIDEEQDAQINELDLMKDTSLTPDSTIIGDVAFENVSFMYPSRDTTPVLRNINLVARANETTALVGSSGCGKSTCISLLLRYYEPLLGRVTINGRPITDFNIKQFRQNIGIVSQEPILFGMNIYENIRLGKLNATRAEIEEAARQANAHNFIMKLPNKYETLVGERGVQLSGGEKQRIALARALVKQPSILLLDEATSALDNVSEKIVQEALDRACKNRTTIIVAHRLTTIQNADKIYVLDKGNVIEEGTHETLMAKEDGRYRTLVKSQQTDGEPDDTDQISMATAVAEEEKQRTERVRAFSEGEAIDITRKGSISSDKQSPFVRLLLMNKTEWINIVIGCIACIIQALSQPVFAALLAKIVKAFKSCDNTNPHHQVFILCIFFLLLGLVILVIRFVQYTAFAISGSKLTHRVRAKAFKCLLRQEVAYFDRPENTSGAISSRLSSEAANVQELAGTRLGVLCESLALAFFGLLFGVIFSIQLTLVVLAFLLFPGLIAVAKMQLSRWLKTKLNIIIERSSTLSVEVLHNIRTVKQLSIEDEVFRRYSKDRDDIMGLFWQPTILAAAMFGLFWAIDPLIIACLYWRALILVEHHILDPNKIIMVFAFATFALQSLKIVGMLAERLGFSMSAADTFFQLFDRTPEIDNISTKGKELPDFRGDIEFEQVKFVYPTRPTTLVLNKLRLSAKSGQRVALVGTSGCGKSTTIQLLERFYDSSQGRVLLDGVDIRELNLQWLRSRIGLVSQEPILFDLTIAENITYGLENIPMSEIIDAAIKANIHQFINQLPQAYDTRVGMKGSFLSGGEKQRIAIARVLLRRPKILLLDEATSAMDSYNEQIVQQALEQAQTEDPTRTSLIIAHRLSTIRSCDLICVLERGRIVESGTHTDLIQQRGIYYGLLSQNTA
ncbi:unnamed protein product [Adineta steineri]|uniref:Uncharacterized protein n=1 Tax=Adineta steineri TaxID=433720 RepID=A0A815AGC9_9BILA|nr:unnamed protein product [Adineta steineri]CAF3664446.1 unnamed protein product [Adineta steineri]